VAPAKFKPVDEQFSYLKKGTAEIVRARRPRGPSPLANTTKRSILSAALAGILSLMPLGELSANTYICSPVRLKPLHCARGMVVDISGGPVDDATVTIFRDGTAAAVVHGQEDGKFSFDALQPGSYELQVEALGFQTFRFPIVIAKPQAKCSRALRVKLVFGSGCPGVWLVKR